jgi:transposase
MSRLIKLVLSDVEKDALEKGSKHGSSHSYRQRCQMILLKTQHKPSREIATELGCCMMAVNAWVRRYQQQGIAGLKTRSGRGRKAILSSEQDLSIIRDAVTANRQRLCLTQESLQKELGKEFSTMTLKRFLKSITADTNESVEK